jgi:hypothetical protein
MLATDLTALPGPEPTASLTSITDMTGVKYSGFSGEVPRAAPKLLQISNSQLASNCKLTSGELAPWRIPSFVTTLQKYAFNSSPVKSLYRLNYNGNDYWLHWTASELNGGEVVKVFNSPTVDDTYGRIYFNKGGKLYVTTGALATTGAHQRYPIAAYELGIVPPTAAPTVTEGTSGTLPDVTVTYIVTYVSEFGEESSPSEAVSATGKPVTGSNSWTIGLPTLPTQSADEVPYAFVNVYRTYTLPDGTATYYLVDQIDKDEVSYVDTLPDENLILNETLPSLEWANPPEDITSFTYMGNGVFAVISGNTLYLSEPYQPHSFPVTYRRSIGVDAVAIEAIGNSLIVLTNGDPIVLTGTDPTFLSDSKLDINQPCLSAASVVNLGHAVAYMSPVGLVFAGLGGSNVATRPLFAKSDWLEISPNSASIATRYDDGVLFLTATHGYLMTPSEPLSVLSSFTVTEVTSLYTDTENGNLYYVRNGGLYKWDSGDDKLAYLWRSRVELWPNHLNLGACKIVSNAVADTPGNTEVLDGGLGINEVGINGAPVPYQTTDPTLTFRLYAWREATQAFELKLEKAVTSQSVFRLPSGYKSKESYIELEGTATVQELYIAETVQELKAM